MTTTVADRPGRLARSVAIVGLAAVVGAAIGAVALRLVDPAPPIPDTFGFGDLALVGFEVMGVAFASVGALLMWRRPRNAVGWLMVLIGVGYAGGGLLAAMTFSANAGDSDAARRLTPYLAWLTVLFTTLGSAIFAIGFIFPTGRGQTPGWQRFVRLVAVVWPIALAMILVQPGPLNIFPTIGNPFGIGPDLRAVIGVQYSSSVAATSVFVIPVLAWSLTSRYRLGGDVERHQLKWFGLALVISIASAAFSGLWAFMADDPPELGLAGFAFGGALVAGAIGIAITRYHLYDIDHIISRTLAYGVVSVILFAVFASVNLGLQAAMGGLTGNSPIVVAVSTLSVAALFQPVRRRVQAIVDGRFARAQYDADRTVRAFASRLRDETDMETVTSDLARTARQTMAPTTMTIWLRPKATVR